MRELISYLPEEAGAYKNMKAIDYLKFVAEVFFDDRAHIDRALDTAREVTGLGDRLNDKLGSYSKGMTRKLLLARTVMTQPRLAILDEPTSGLDVINALELRERVSELADGGMSVLLSSHNMLEIEFLSDRVAIIADGRIHDAGTAAELKAELRRRQPRTGLRAHRRRPDPCSSLQRGGGAAMRRSSCCSRRSSANSSPRRCSCRS